MANGQLLFLAPTIKSELCIERHNMFGLHTLLISCLLQHGIVRLSLLCRAILVTLDPQESEDPLVQRYVCMHTFIYLLYFIHVYYPIMGGKVRG